MAGSLNRLSGRRYHSYFLCDRRQPFSLGVPTLSLASLVKLTENEKGKQAGKEPAMANRTLAPSATRTVGDLLARLDGIPPERIRLHPAPGTATVKDVIAILAREDRCCELIDGVAVEKPIGWYESYLAMIIGHFIQSYLDTHDLGIVAGEQGMILLLPHQIRIADVSFYSWDHFPNRKLPTRAVPRRYPDLAVEVLSPSNTKKEMRRKLREYFQAGTRLVWMVDPMARTVRVYTGPRKFKLVTEADTLDGGDLLPGSRLPLRKLFARARLQNDD
jgi:Uma2 family endonuclease